MTDQPRTPLYDEHVAAGAAFTDFGGWQMPVRYSSDLAEHHAVRSAAGLFDISHMAQLAVSGPDAAEFLAWALAADVPAIRVSRARYTMILAEDGGVIDDLIVSRLGDEQFLVVANAANRAPVRAALGERLVGPSRSFDATVDDLAPRALIAVQGPLAQRILETTPGLEPDAGLAMGHDLASVPYYACLGMRFAGRAVLISRTGYTGEDGFEIAVDADDAPGLWRALLAVGGPLGLVPAGLAARDTLRLEAGMPLYGHELGRGVRPSQAGLGRVAPPPSKTADFVGRAALETPLPADAPVLVGLAAEGRRAGRAGYPVLAPGTADVPDAVGVVGEITSGALSPTLGHPIAMAMVQPGYQEPGTALDIDVRGTRVPATVVPLPFYRRPAPSTEPVASPVEPVETPVVEPANTDSADTDSADREKP